MHIFTLVNPNTQSTIRNTITGSCHRFLFTTKEPDKIESIPFHRFIFRNTVDSEHFTAQKNLIQFNSIQHPLGPHAK
jgi:hypothetical protein